MKPLNKSTMHLGRMNPDINLNDDVMYIQRFDAMKNGNPIIPLSPGIAIKALTSKLDGMYLHGGYVNYKGSLLHLFDITEAREHPHYPGIFTNYGIIWFKLRYAKNQIITLMALDRGTDVLPLGSHDGNEIDWVIDELYPIQENIVRKTLEHLSKNEPLPDPPITYEIL